MRLSKTGTAISAVYAICAIVLLSLQFKNVIANLESDFLVGAPAFIAGHVFITRKFDATHELIKKENTDDN